MEENNYNTGNGLQNVNDDNKKARNGQQQVDYFNPENNTLDIRSNGMYPSGVFSNLCSNGFRFEGMVCGSMEGFLPCRVHQRQKPPLPDTPQYRGAE